nr:MAG TPA: hypothetical protein [Caudoviricetes sp.]
MNCYTSPYRLDYILYYIKFIIFSHFKSYRFYLLTQ